MKPIRLCAFIGLVILLFGMEPQNILAQELNGCAGNPPTFKNSSGGRLSPLSGVTISVEILAGGNSTVQNFVVFGQDPEEEGLSLTVKVTPEVGIVSYDEKVPTTYCVDTYENDAIAYSKYCEMGYPYSKQYRYKTIEECHSGITSPAQRTIKNIKVWLEPSDQTSRWLGWSQSGEGEKAPLRYMFPDKWMVGNWTADGFTTIGTPDLSWSETYYQNWLSQMAGYNFLAGDTAAMTNLWSVTLVEVESPSLSPIQSLGIFGNLNPGMYFNPHPSGSTSGSQNISYDEMNSYKKLNWATSNYVSTDPLPPYLKSLELTMRHIPMDLPGAWMVGVLVELDKATFTYKYHDIPGTEVPDKDFWGGNDTRWITLEEAGSSLLSNVFYEYVLLSSPCNPMEKDNCWDNSY